MFKQSILFACLLNCGLISLGQSAAGPTAAAEALHISGTNNKVRVDGLNETNNANNLGGTDLYPLTVDATGNSTLNAQSNLLLSQSVITTSVEVPTQANSAIATADIYQQNFTLTRRALVVITYCVGLEFKSFDGLSNLNDGRVKVAQNYFYLGDGTTEDSSTAYGQASCNYSNYYCDTATGYVYNSNSVIITLPAGTHSIHMKGAAIGGGASSDAAFRAIFTPLDRIDISAIYL